MVLVGPHGQGMRCREVSTRTGKLRIHTGSVIMGTIVRESVRRNLFINSQYWNLGGSDTVGRRTHRMLTLAIHAQNAYSGNILAGCLLLQYTHRMLTLSIYAQVAYSGNIRTGCLLWQYTRRMLTLAI